MRSTIINSTLSPTLQLVLDAKQIDIEKKSQLSVEEYCYLKFYFVADALPANFYQTSFIAQVERWMTDPFYQKQYQEEGALRLEHHEVFYLIAKCRSTGLILGGVEIHLPLTKAPSKNAYIQKIATIGSVFSKSEHEKNLWGKYTGWLLLTATGHHLSHCKVKNYHLNATAKAKAFYEKFGLIQTGISGSFTSPDLPFPGDAAIQRYFREVFTNDPALFFGNNPASFEEREEFLSSVMFVQRRFRLHYYLKHKSLPQPRQKLTALSPLTIRLATRPAATTLLAVQTGGAIVPTSFLPSLTGGQPLQQSKAVVTASALVRTDAETPSNSLLQPLRGVQPLQAKAVTATSVLVYAESEEDDDDAIPIRPANPTPPATPLPTITSILQRNRRAQVGGVRQQVQPKNKFSQRQLFPTNIFSVVLPTSGARKIIL